MGKLGSISVSWCMCSSFPYMTAQKGCTKTYYSAGYVNSCPSLFVCPCCSALNDYVVLSVICIGLSVRMSVLCLDYMMGSDCQPVPLFFCPMSFLYRRVFFFFVCSFVCPLQGFGYLSQSTCLSVHEYMRSFPYTNSINLLN